MTLHKTLKIKGFDYRPARIKRLILVPLNIVLLLVVSAMFYLAYLGKQQAVEAKIDESADALEKQLSLQLEKHAETLSAVIEILSSNAEIQTAFERRDRAALIEFSTPIYEKLKQRNGITHWYYHKPDAVNFIRVHQTDHREDYIDRYTLSRAMETNRPYWGMELGVLGTFTLRYVSPFYREGETKELLGYIELGIEIDHILKELAALIGTDVFLLIDKNYLDRAMWENAVRVKGGRADWEKFGGFVDYAGAGTTFPEELEGLLKSSPGNGRETFSIFGKTGPRLVALLRPLFDAAGREIGKKAIMVDLSREQTALQKTLLLSLALFFVSALLLYILLYFLLKKLTRYEIALRAMAQRDHLTGLFNKRMCHQLLKGEIQRSARTGNPFSLLLIDLDHFKRINDTYGHLAGDKALKSFAGMLVKNARVIDTICRYGGEEFIVILPETSDRSATEIAERLRAAIDKESFAIEKPVRLHLTVSIGIASFPLHAATFQTLIDAADRAMYEAKKAGRNKVRHPPELKSASPKR
ncbi:MAG: diguanylate cyclase [Gammaproteobacteria bacterium]